VRFPQVGDFQNAAVHHKFIVPPEGQRASSPQELPRASIPEESNELESSTQEVLSAGEDNKSGRRGLTAEQIPRRPGTAPAFGLRAGSGRLHSTADRRDLE
jgi:hypothetical protein